MTARAMTLAGFAVVLLAATASSGDGYDENWNSGSNNKWAYWDTDYGAYPNHHHPMDYFGVGGVGGSGYVSTPLENMEPAFVHDVAAYWPAYPGENFEFEPFPYIDLRIPGAAVSVYVKGGHNPVVPPVNLAGGQVRFFIGYYDTKGNADPNDDEQAFFCTKGTFAVGDNLWAETTVFLGGDDDWLTIVREETLGTQTQPTHLYDGPQQWGFTIYPVPLGSFPHGGTLGFDDFQLIPEPATLSLLALGGLAVLRRRRGR